MKTMPERLWNLTTAERRAIANLPAVREAQAAYWQVYRDTRKLPLEEWAIANDASATRLWDAWLAELAR